MEEVYTSVIPQQKEIRLYMEVADKPINDKVRILICQNFCFII